MKKVAGCKKHSINPFRRSVEVEEKQARTADEMRLAAEPVSMMRARSTAQCSNAQIPGDNM